MWAVATLLLALAILSFAIAPSFAQTSVAPPTYTLSVPRLIELGGNVDPSPHGEQRMMTTTFHNSDTKPVHFVAFLEIRDGDGITVFLQFHSGTAPGFGGSVDVASSWQPEKEGEYELRTFAISNFTRPEVLVCCEAPVNVTIK